MTTDRPTDKTILITGGAGFIGSHLSTALVDDNDIRVLDSLTTGSRENVPTGATLIEGDLRDEDALARATDGVDLIFHEAALVSVQGSVEAPLTSHEINVDATLDVLEAARNEDARVVLASSAAIYGHPEQVPITETDPKSPTSPYGLDKLTIDHYAHQYHDLYDLETVALRYFNAYGPGQVAGDYSGVISVFIDQALSDEEITVYGEGDQTRDFVYIDDIVRANQKAATTDAVGDAYNIGTGESVTIRELAELIQEITDTDSDIVHMDARTGDIEHSEANISKAQNQLDYEPTVSLREGLEQTVTWYRSQRD
ncbi:NAD-dependent epimerase/dehydratase family protein [Natronorubrum thiooxidans]|uniref:UDP-glucose 4-epimerase n=1 Tax=Natronorubrum thiooxidans TaxID=308853 RepID=A0A1N7GDA1_9EURY|nr:NAD-dependent epimerase/dehydratase family protein [Natronorubrum thiooxidans]SIS10587.1 UDP-glucose 4-epimerase [Natronorubrum thiooxidans]